VAQAAKRILIVDDQPHVLGVLRELVASYRHEHPYEITTMQAVATRSASCNVSAST